MASASKFSWRRSVAWAVALGLHVLVLVGISLPPQGPRGAMPMASVDDSVVRVDWAVSTRAGRGSSSRAAASLPLPMAARPPVRPLAGASSRPLRTDETPALAPPPPSVITGGAASPYLDDDARARLPFEPLYAAGPAPRTGDWHTPGDGSEDDVFDRPLALDPAPSRFAKVWTESRGTVVDEWLGKVVEKATGTVSIPLNSKFKLVCGTVAGLAGGCLIVRDGGTGVIVQRPPPAPWERSNRVQCRELRDALAAADDGERIAFLLERLSALCTTGAGNEEARRMDGLPEVEDAAGEHPAATQRAR